MSSLARCSIGRQRSGISSANGSDRITCVMTSDRADLKRILLVDDDALLLRILANVLQTAGYIVCTAANGRLGFEACCRSVPDLVITDLAMPEMDGITFIRHARRTFPALPVVAMSGGLVDSGENLERAVALGAIATLQKPFPLDELLIVVKRALIENRAHGDAHAVRAE